jgi:hypothetical protein
MAMKYLFSRRGSYALCQAPMRKLCMSDDEPATVTLRPYCIYAGIVGLSSSGLGAL